MGKEFSWLIPDHMRYHRFWDNLTVDELTAGVELFIDLNKQYAPQPIHIIVDMRDVTRHSLSMVHVYRLTQSLSHTSTGHMLILAKPINHSMHTLFSLIDKIVANVFHIPYRNLFSLDECMAYCQTTEAFSPEELQIIADCYQSDHLVYTDGFSNLPNHSHK